MNLKKIWAQCENLPHKDFLITLASIIFFLIIHSIYFSHKFVFIYDQVSSSTEALEIWQQKKLSLIGPHVSFNVSSRFIYFGGISYYIQLFFLLLGKFDPFWATYFFMIACAAMIIPLYLGVKKLINREAAALFVAIYSFLPFFIESTVTLWNPYFLLMLMPILIYLMSIFNEKKHFLIFFLIAVLNGVLFQLHYFYIFSLIGLLVYYFFVKKIKWWYVLIFLLGFAIGFSNMILFELRHQFYNLSTILLYMKSPNKFGQQKFASYYLLSEFVFGILVVLAIFRKKLKPTIVIAIYALLFVYAFFYVTFEVKKTIAPPGWYYKDELKVYEIIKNNYSKVPNFNIFEFYDAQGLTQKYFMKRDGLTINFDDYYNNKFLYVLYKGNHYDEDVAYEVHNFRPARVVKTWQINKTYKLFLLERKKSV